MAQKMKITYLDGNEVEVTVPPFAHVMTERFLRQQGGVGDSTLVDASFRLAYESLSAHKKLPPGVAYEEWGATLAEFPEVIEDEPVDPTPEAPSPTPSSD